MTIKDLAKEDNLGLMPGAFLYELRKYHQRVRSNLRSDIEEFETSQPQVLEILGIGESGDSNCQWPTISGLPSWLGDYISRIGESSVTAFFDFTDFHLKFVEHSQGLESKYGDKCESCVETSEEALRAIWEAVLTVVQGSIAKVRFTYLTASLDGPERGVQAESDFALGDEETRSQNETQARSFREDPSLPRYLEMPSVDVIIQSSDNVNFRVHRSVMATSSPFFRDMFSLPQPSSDASDELPVVRVSEAADVLNSLLSMLYHVPPEMPHSSDNILALLAATDKYDMGGPIFHPCRG
jgi:hypothetical protein